MHRLRICVCACVRACVCACACGGGERVHPCVCVHYDCVSAPYICVRCLHCVCVWVSVVVNCKRDTFIAVLLGGHPACIQSPEYNRGC